MIWHAPLAMASPRILLPHQPQPIRAVRYLRADESAPRIVKGEMTVSTVELLRKLRRVIRGVGFIHSLKPPVIDYTVSMRVNAELGQIPQRQRSCRTPVLV